MSAAAAPVSDLGTRHGSSMPLAVPAAPNFSQSAPVALPGPRSRTDGAGGPQRFGARPGPVAQAARGRSTSTPAATALQTPSADTSPSRAAVTGASNRASSTPSTSGASGLTADPPHNRPPSAGSGAAPLQTYPQLLR